MKRLVIRKLGNVPYEETWQCMKKFTEDRGETTHDELWWLEHPAVYTLGQAGKTKHLLTPGDISVVKTDRGGQVTFHGPGQLVVYLLIDIKRMGANIRNLVSGIERSIVDLLNVFSIQGLTRKNAPGVYVAGKKIASIGLRVRNGYTYHGMSLNVDMDLEPFSRINPCGYEGLEVVDLKTLGLQITVDQVAERLTSIIGIEFGYDALIKNINNRREHDDGR